eukprot:GCRY01000079.1.p1 GENE.GCRY01000079.1~~GCRY01000079.1.p1  ORF type:complete len:259 (+),score=13.56 GCRY01000079.1:81-779(+)
MFKQSLILIACFAALGSAFPSFFDSPKYDDSFDFYVLALQWPGHQETFPENVTSFTLLGLWPTRNDSTWPSNCDSRDEFDMGKIKDILPDMLKYWPSYMEDSDRFWDHEWTTHGTCAKSNPRTHDEYHYFKEALAATQTIPLLKILESQRIYPSTSDKYSLSTFEKAVKFTFDVKPFFQCGSRSGGYYLKNAYLCIDMNLNPMDCPPAFASLREKKEDCGSGNSIAFDPIKH